MWTRQPFRSLSPYRALCWYCGLGVSGLVLILIVVGSLVLTRWLERLESSFQAVLSNPPVVAPNDEALEPSHEGPHRARSRLEHGKSRTSS